MTGYIKFGAVLPKLQNDVFIFRLFSKYIPKDKGGKIIEKMYTNYS